MMRKVAGSGPAKALQPDGGVREEKMKTRTRLTLILMVNVKF